jgi:hypothetical protein
MSQNVESILAAARLLPPHELRELLEHLTAELNSRGELHADTELHQKILEGEQQISNGDVVPWSEVKHQHRL